MLGGSSKTLVEFCCEGLRGRVGPSSNEDGGDRAHGAVQVKEKVSKLIFIKEVCLDT